MELNLDEILKDTTYSTKKYVKHALLNLSSKQIQEIQDKKQFMINLIREQYPQNGKSEEMLMKEVLGQYIKKIIQYIICDYGDFIPKDRISKLENMGNKDCIEVINDINGHDLSASSEQGKIIVNLAKIDASNNLRSDIYSKIVCALGGLPHELFHIVINMLKPKECANLRMNIQLKDNDQPLTSFGMVGFMLNEGFAEKISHEFSEKHGLYHTFAFQLLPYIKVCDYIMDKYPQINYKTIFSMDYADCLEYLNEEEKAKYYRAECISYAVRHLKIETNKILNVFVEKRELDSILWEKQVELQEYYDCKNAKLKEMLEIDDD